ncbi:MAG: c-type cytochrome [Helicobacter sp.]|nr:c-type cytochrome [Helicobacteraceae bacterium]MDY3113936.1 c-type cytochrome [Helicobacter sp.]
MKKVLLGILLASGALMAADGAAIYKKCIACHGANGERVAPGSVGGVKIAGMDKARLVEQLKGYAAGTADNGGAKAIMYSNMKNWKLTDADIEAVADHISKLPPVK